MSILRDRLAKKIMKSFPGFKARAEDLIPATGSWLTNIQLDVFCWEGFITGPLGVRRFTGSYDTMTTLVRSDVKLCFLDNFEIAGIDA